MRKRNFILVCIGIILFTSCKSNEEKAMAVVNEFLIGINDPTKNVNSNLMTENFFNFIKDKPIYSANKWELSVKAQSDTVFIVESTGNTYNKFGTPINIVQGFSLTNEFGGWKIFDTYNLAVDNINFKVVDDKWGFYWDREKYEILNEIKEKVELEIIADGYGSYYSDFVRGNLRVINNSEFDIKGVEILIEHFDKEGKSVNTDYANIWDVIRKNGYREFEWFTNDCHKCYSQKFKILFEKES